MVQTTKEYFLSVMLSTLLFTALPASYVSGIQHFLINVLAMVSLDFGSILLSNFCSMIVILVLGLMIEYSTSFFAAMNGAALGIVISIYQNSLGVLLELLFYHSIFETTLIILFCSFVKVLGVAFRNRDRENIKKYGFYMLWTCIPLWILSALIEVSWRI